MRDVKTAGDAARAAARAMADNARRAQSIYERGRAVSAAKTKNKNQLALDLVAHQSRRTGAEVVPLKGGAAILPAFPASPSEFLRMTDARATDAAYAESRRESMAARARREDREVSGGARGRASSMNPMRRAEADARRRSTTNRRAKAASFAMPAISPVQGGRRSSQERGTRRGSAGK